MSLNESLQNKVKLYLNINEMLIIRFNCRSASQPDFTAAANEDSGIGQEVMLQEPASIFERPGFGSVAFR